MNRTEFFNKTRPTQLQLNNTEDTKIDAILVRQRATTQLGVVLGFQVTPNVVDGTLIDIGPGEGYTGGMYSRLNVKGTNSSERIASDYNIITGQALVDYTSGVKNYISIVYGETTDTPLDEIYYPFVAHDTLVHESYSVSVLTEANWNLLTIAQLRERVLVAIVTARGAGVPLTAADIQQTVQPKNLPIATQPTNITGLSVNNVADITAIGTGTLRWEVTTLKLYWTAPGDTEGVGVVISTSGSYTIYSGTTTYYIIVYAISASMPAVNATDTIYIQSMYGATFPRYSAVDSVHREMLGHGVPSIFNPHATSLNDLSGAGFDHAALFHVNGISVLADANQLSCRIDPDPTVDQILVRNLGGRLNSFLIAGTTYTDINGITSGTDAIVSFDTSPPASGEYMIYLDDAANLQKLFLGTALWSANINLVDMKNTTAGAGAVITWNATAKTLTYAAPGDVAGAAVYLMGYDSLVGYYGYYKLYSSDTANWVIVYVGGALGGNNSTTFTTAKNELTNADSSILKLCVVYWDLATEVLSNLRDIRQWGSADWRDKILEEHDENGHHNKVFQSPIRAIAQTGPAISAYAVVGAALALGAPNTAVLCQADTAVGVMGSAATMGVYGTALTAVGVYGAAPNTAGEFVAATAVAGYFSAPNNAIVGRATTARAASFSAPNSALVVNAATGMALYASAPGSAAYLIASNTALYVEAKTAIAISASAYSKAIDASAVYSAVVVSAGVDKAIYAIAGNNTALYAEADGYAVKASAIDYAVYANASDGFAVYASAPNSVIVGYAATNAAAYFSAPNKAVTALAATATAMYAQAPLVGILGRATTATAISADAPNVAIDAQVATATAIYANAAGAAIVAIATGSMAFSGSAQYFPLHITTPNCAAFIGANWGPFCFDVPTTNAAGALVSYIQVYLGPLGASSSFKMPIYAWA